VLGGGRHGEPLEVVAHAHVRVETGGVLVEVEKGPRTAVEDAARSFNQSRDSTELLEEGLEFVERVGSCVSHRPDRSGGAEAPRGGRGPIPSQYVAAT